LGCAHPDPHRALGEDSWIVRRRAAVLDSAAIPQPEYEAIKAKALA
jgi:hypothetical protein